MQVFILFESLEKPELRKDLEAPGIDPGTSRMLSERSTIWATPPPCRCILILLNDFQVGNRVNKFSRTNTDNQNDDLHKFILFHVSFDSSVGRAVDCSCTLSDIHRSLVQIRLEGFFFSTSTDFSITELTHIKWMPPFCFAGKSRHLLYSLEARVAQSVER